MEASVRLELTTFALTARRSNQLSHKAIFPHLFVFPADRNIPAKNRYDFYSLILYAPPRTYRNGANSGNRTRTFCLEGRCSTIKLYRQKRQAAWKREKSQCHFEKIGQIGKECYANRKNHKRKRMCYDRYTRCCQIQNKLHAAHLAGERDLNPHQTFFISALI